MQLNRILLGAFTAVSGLLGGITMAAMPANAATKYVGQPGSEARCSSHTSALACFYYSEWNSAYWGKGVSDADLSNNRYLNDTGSGAGQLVRTNSRKLVCKAQVPTKCESYSGANYTGNIDWMYSGERGELSYTWNKNVSLKIS